jgi:hypothetical protein
MNNSSEIGNGYILLLWDALVRNSNAFIEEYREYILSRQSTKVPFNAHGTIIEGEIHNAKFLHSKNFDWSALLGYVKSYGSMVVTELIESELKNIFYKHAVNGIVTLDYTCDVYAGKLK